MSLLNEEIKIGWSRQHWLLEGVNDRIASLFVDALLIIAPPGAADYIIGVLRSKDIAA